MRVKEFTVVGTWKGEGLVFHEEAATASDATIKALEYISRELYESAEFSTEDEAMEHAEKMTNIVAVFSGRHSNLVK